MKLSKVFGIVLSLHVGVILLVMFQPSCQTTTGVKKPLTKDESPADQEDANPQPFNQGVTGENELSSSEEKFSLPRRPAAGELLVPQEPPLFPSPEPVRSIIVPGQDQEQIQIRPVDLSIYKVVRGDTLWGIAKKHGVTFSSLLAANQNMDNSGRLSIGQELVIPSGSISSPIVSPSPVVNLPLDGAESYVVAKGDTLSGIARKHGLKLSALLNANGMSMSSVIRPGQTLRLPGQSSSAGVSEKSPAPTPSIPSAASTHKVMKGENLSRISAIYGVTVAQIMEWNGISNPSLIREGQSLIISMGTIDTPIPETSSPVTVPAESQSAEPSGSLQDFFNDSSGDDRPIIDAP